MKNVRTARCFLLRLRGAGRRGSRAQDPSVASTCSRCFKREASNLQRAASVIDESPRDCSCAVRDCALRHRRSYDEAQLTTPGRQLTTLAGADRAPGPGCNVSMYQCDVERQSAGDRVVWMLGGRGDVRWVRTYGARLRSSRALVAVRL